MTRALELPPPANPHRTNPPEGSVGIVLPIRDDLPFFKLTFHALRSFTDYRHMLTIVDNMCSYSTRGYLTGLQRNHTVNVLQYQRDNQLEEIWNVGLRFMFGFASVKYGLVLTPNIIVEPRWLSGLVHELVETKAKAISPKSNGLSSRGCILFRREDFEQYGSVNAIPRGVTDQVYAHKFKMNGFDPRDGEPQSADAVPETQEVRA